MEAIITIIVKTVITFSIYAVICMGIVTMLSPIIMFIYETIEEHRFENWFKEQEAVKDAMRQRKLISKNELDRYSLNRWDIVCIDDENNTVILESR